MPCLRLSLDRVDLLCYICLPCISVASSAIPSRDIKGPQRRYDSRVRFFYGPPIRHAGILSPLHARRIMLWLMERSNGLTTKKGSGSSHIPPNYVVKLCHLHNTFDISTRYAHDVSSSRTAL